MDDLLPAALALLAEVPEAANVGQDVGVVAVRISTIARLRKAVEG